LEPEEKSPEVEKGTPPVPTGIGGQTWRRTLMGALVGFGIGTVLILILQLSNLGFVIWEGLLLGGTIGAIIGAIVGVYIIKRRAIS
jgi:hypothetical protein